MQDQIVAIAAKFPIKSVAVLISEMFDRLGRPEHVGSAFAITMELICDFELKGKDGKLRLDKLPRPDYEHRILHDQRTDNYMVLRPDAQGQYADIEHTKRVR